MKKTSVCERLVFSLIKVGVVSGAAGAKEDHTEPPAGRQTEERPQQDARRTALIKARQACIIHVHSCVISGKM